MSSFQATRRASARSSIVQHPPYTESAFCKLSYICIERPTTSCPADLRMYAAVDESTPPDMATAIFTARPSNKRHCSCMPEKDEWSHLPSERAANGERLSLSSMTT